MGVLKNWFEESLSPLLEDLFVPEFDGVNRVKSTLEEKLPMIAQLTEITSHFTSDYSETSTPPTFTITYKGQTLNILNLSFLQPYVTTIKSILSAIWWVMFALWLVKYAPKMIGGFR